MPSALSGVRHSRHGQSRREEERERRVQEQEKKNEEGNEGYGKNV